MTGSDFEIGGILLAAGGSSRLGRPKQLVEFEGEPLIRRAAEALIDAGCSPVVVVLGAEIDASRDALSDLAIEIVENPEWAYGMSSSIRSGIERMKELDAALITLSDQPLVTADKLRAFSDRFADGWPPIVAARYNGVLGVPALFSAGLFEALTRLEGDKGARELIRNCREAAAIDLPEAAVDIDTLDDLARAGASPPS